MSTLNKYLLNKRLDKGLTQKDVAEKLNLASPQFISNIERGVSKPPLRALKKLIDLYDLNKQELAEYVVQEKRRHIERVLDC